MIRSVLSRVADSLIIYILCPGLARFLIGGIMKKIVACFTLILLSVLLPIPAQAHNVRVFQPQSSPYGQDYPGWLAEWGDWLFEIPVDQNPAVHPESCDEDQEGGRVWFLGPSGADDCEVPAGKAVAFSPFGFECSTAEGNGETFAQLRKCAREGFASFASPEDLNLRIRIDGRRLPNPHRWTFITPGEVLDFPEDNLFGAEAGPTLSVTKALFYILRPLSPGQHTIRVNATDFGEDVTLVYRFKVVPHNESERHLSSTSPFNWSKV